MRLKRSLPILSFIAVLGMYSVYFMDRYVIAANSTVSNCLHATYFLVDKWDQDVGVGDLAAFKMMVENPLYPTGRKWIKQVVATEGMTVRVDRERVRFSDGRTIESNMDHTMGYLKLEPSDIKPVVTLGRGQLFMMGDTRTSYDSRYWGAIEQQHILGKAYALF
jgi:conjugal transfer pilin signal peptidase TrbI